MNSPQSLSPESDSPLLSDALRFVRAHADQLHLPSGEGAVEHALGTLRILKTLKADHAAQAAAVLFSIAAHVEIANEQFTERFGAEVAQLVADVCKLMRLSIAGEKAANSLTASRAQRDIKQQRRAQVEALRKMLLAFSQDIRIVLIRLASRLQTLRYHAAQKVPLEPEIARETLDLDAPLANRLGIWQLKWELEDLAFRFEDPQTYKRIARWLDEKRVEREAFIAQAIKRLQSELQKAEIKAEISGRPKHIYSIWRKMRGKQIDFSELYDVHAFRVIVDDVKDCYAVLGIVHHIWQPIPKEFDDYISRPKPNGYKSLHTVVLDDEGRALEVQIRTTEMHRFSEYGVAAHWRYKESGSKGYRGQFAAAGQYDQKIAWLRQLVAWKTETTDNLVSSKPATADAKSLEPLQPIPLDDRLYVLTPQARVVELPRGATPVDFAYYLHTELGHRCRGARIDGAMVPLNTALQNGQTVEIVAVKQGGPSRDWLNAQHGYLHSARAKQKVRAWFNAIEAEENIAQGRALVEKTLQREGKTSVNLDELAAKLNFKTSEELFTALSKEEFSLRHVEQVLREAPIQATQEPLETTTSIIPKKNSNPHATKGAANSVLVVGVGALASQFARCCHPAPPDAISGFITRGKGVSIHRAHCPSFARLAKRAPERIVQTSWSTEALSGKAEAGYIVDLSVEAVDRPGLLRDISEILVREKINVLGGKAQSKRSFAMMHFTVEVPNTRQVQRALILLGKVPGVLHAVRKN